MTTSTSCDRGCGCGCGGPCADPPPYLTIDNAPGLARIAYRVGDFTTFRRALLQHRSGEVDLLGWQPTAGEDLGLQLLDWWAYVADVLTFYNEQIANEGYLGTATLEASARNLTALLGYRPRPGLGARGRLAVLASSLADLVVPAGFAVGSQATPDVQAQTFETSTAVTFAPPSSVPPAAAEDTGTPAPAGGPPATAPPGTVALPPHQQLLARGGVLLLGRPTGLTAGDQLLLTTQPWLTADDPAALVTVTAIAVESDPHGRKNTRVQLSGTGALPSSATAAGYRLLRPTRSLHLAGLPSGATTITDSLLVLDGPARYLRPGDPLVVGSHIARLTAYTEALWYANAAATDPTKPPASPATPIPLIVATLSVALRSGDHLAGTSAASATVLAGWTPVGTLMDTPVAAVAGVPATVTLGTGVPGGRTTTPTGAQMAQIEDRTGIGADVLVTPGSGGTAQIVPVAGLPARPLQAPLRLLWDLVDVSRGETVRDEQLGIGDATRAGQDFTLSRGPVTYLTDYPGRSGDGWSSTVTLTVGERIWTEVRSLYGRGPAEAVFETYEDTEQKTHIRTGDGRYGRRLPTGAAVAVTYRVGSGAAVPPPGTLTQVLTAVPNLRAIRNPVGPAGGADPEPGSSVRQLAPRSVLTLGRAISGDDYAAVAAAAPGVNRAIAVWEWDPDEQRPAVRVYVGDDAAALTAARAAIARQADPARPVVTVAAVPRPIRLDATVQIDPSFVVADVLVAVTTAITGLFAPGVLALGDPVFRSRVEQVVLAAPGAVAVAALSIGFSGSAWEIGPRLDPGAGGFCTLAPGDLTLTGTGAA